MGIILLVTFSLLLLSNLYSNILTTSFLGAYILIVPFDYYTDGNIRYIFLNTVHRATVPNFNLAVIDPQFQPGGKWFFFAVAPRTPYYIKTWYKLFVFG